MKQTDKQGGIQRQGENITRARIHNSSLFFFAFTLSSRRGNYSSDGQSMCPRVAPNQAEERSSPDEIMVTVDLQRRTLPATPSTNPSPEHTDESSDEDGVQTNNTNQ